MYINKVRVKNYKSFKDSGEVELDMRLFGIIGQNNTGKSALIDAIQCFFPSSKKGIVAADFHKGTHENIEIDMWFKGISEEYLEKIFFEDKIKNEEDKLIKKYNGEIPENTLMKLEEKIEEIKKTNLEKLYVKYGIENEEIYIKLISEKGSRITKKYYKKDDTEIKESELKNILPSIKVIPALRDPKNESTAGNNSYLKELIQMLDDEIQTNIEIQGNNITYKELNEVISKETSKRCSDIAKQITMFYNKAIGSKDYEIIIDSDVNIASGTKYTTRIRDIVTKIESDILSCGTGYQSMVILSILETYVEISKNKSKYILLIEEPEVYLHPQLQRKMIDTLVSISNTNQVIFTSHSPITVSKLTQQQLKLITKANGEAKVNNISVNEVISELGIKGDDILNHKGIIFVEGKDDKAIISRLLSKIDSELERKINIIPTGSCTNLKFYANAEILINNSFKVPTLIVRDSDCKSVDIRREELIKEIIDNSRIEIDEDIREKIQKSVRVIDNYSIEGYYIDYKFLSEIIDDDEKINKSIKCYECQYKDITYRAKVGELKEEEIGKYYQPKHFFEGFLDKAESEREIKNKVLESKWRKFDKCLKCEEDIEIFINVRREINKITEKMKLQKKDFFCVVLENMDLNEILETKLSGLVKMLNEFKNELN
ncbi:Predicted ATP-binding protein involved in virulence [uncultured Clostridium sp.]|uniref:ATP-dependent nuclease n=1 Tax=uncultured Clostridium sp. TaxID=59620 RepID=UPI000821F755|nr:AAA family ATPase [uncultured Clostridium sp.]SCJ97203.1 Predicted ATP-binding protein involved in virulence [uncultured Clostridium sp.]